MLNPLNLISKFIKSSNQKELDRLGNTILKKAFMKSANLVSAILISFCLLFLTSLTVTG